MKKRRLFSRYLFLLVLISLSVFFSCTTTEDVELTVEQEKILEFAEKEIEVGRAVFAKLAGKYGIVRNEAATKYLNKLGKSLALYTERQELEYFFAILNTEEINGYALPGGYILITLGALKQIKEPGALAGILAHELGHALGLGHPPGNSSENSLMEPSGFCLDNPALMSKKNCDNADNPLLKTRFFPLYLCIRNTNM